VKIRLPVAKPPAAKPPVAKPPVKSSVAKPRARLAAKPPGKPTIKTTRATRPASPQPFKEDPFRYLFPQQSPQRLDSAPSGSNRSRAVGIYMPNH
jgi:hypothetical protein